VHAVFLVLGALVMLQSDPGDPVPDSPKEVLRMHLHGVLSHPSTLNFEVPPLYELQGKCDIPGTLIDILQEQAKTPEKEQEGISAIRVLNLYWQKYPDARIPLSLGKYCLDPERPALVRNEALLLRGGMPGPETPAFYAEVIRNLPELAGPLVRWLEASASRKHANWMTIRELYTPDVRSALQSYIESRVRIPSLLPEDRKWYEAMIGDLDRAAGLLPDRGGNNGNPTTNPPSSRSIVATPGASGDAPPPKGLPNVPLPNPGTHEISRSIVFAGLSIGVLGILLYRILRRK